MNKVIHAAITVALAAAGCLAATDADPGDDGASHRLVVPPAPDFDFSTLVDPDHPAHSVPALHAGSHGLALVGHTGVGAVLPPGTPGSISTVDVHDGLAVVPGFARGTGFVLVDLADPAAPRPVGHFASIADGWTARFSDDGAFVFFGCQLASEATGALVGDCEDPGALHAPGATVPSLVAVDVGDPASPRFVASVPVDGSHNVFAFSADGVDYVVTAAVEIVRFDRDPPALTVVARVPGVHDASVALHPLDGRRLLYTGAGEGSFAIYDLARPEAPEIVYEGDLAGVVGWHEQTPIPVPVGGRALLAVGGESSSSADGALLESVFIVDVTDPAAPSVLGEWRPPIDPAVPWTSYLYTGHEIAASATGQLAVAWWHAGVWVIDVSTPERAREPVTLAAYMPSMEINVLPGRDAQDREPFVPNVWGVNWDRRGFLVVPDAHTGVYVLEPAWGLVPGLDGGN